uniref:Uncharacterized protein n=1 Tax=Anguilla anguilla TaxID=7936 RepID=A0A0E9SMP8_ANGAN
MAKLALATRSQAELTELACQQLGTVHYVREVRFL